MRKVIFLVSLSLLSAACSTGDSNNRNRVAATAATYQICPGPEAQNELLRAFFEATEGDTIELCAGEFAFNREMPVHDKRGITFKGAGKDQTILDFAGSNDAWGVSAGRMHGFTIQGMTIRDAKSVGILFINSEQVTMRDLRVLWSDWESCEPAPDAPTSCSAHGEVGAVFEFGKDVLVEDSEFYGAALFGLGFLLPRDVTIRRVRTQRNAIGLFLNNARRLTVTESDIEQNSVGVLHVDEADINPFAGKTVFTGNRVTANNTPNFVRTGHGLAGLPPGIGFLHVAGDQFEITQNEFVDNGTTGLAIVNTHLLIPVDISNKADRFPEGINVHDNLFRDNGGQPGIPDPRAGPATAFVPLILAKNLGKSAQIAWDGAVDEPNDCNEVPRDESGIPLNEPGDPSHRSEPRTDERGRPNFELTDPEPSCRWNAWKFDDSGNLKPENRIYIDNNRFESTRPQTALVDDFATFYLTSADPQQVTQDLLIPVSNDLGPHAGVLASLPLAMPNLPYLLDGRSFDDRVTEQQTTEACTAGTNEEVNWAALLRHNCPELQQYGLFADPQDPRHSPNSGGMYYRINTPLFSDYAVKYRFIFVPPGEQIRYADYEGDPDIAWDNNAQRSLDFPVGSVIVKTFAFRTDDESGNTTDENVVETRLLIKRQQYDRVVWVGMAYRWRDTANGRIAELLPEGSNVDVSFDYLDEDPEVLDGDGARQRYTGTAEHYAIPAASSCAACHGGTTRDPGTSPISTKPRHLNRDEHCAATGSKLNQLDCLVATGLLEPLPDVPANLERTPRWNVPGDSGEPANSSQDVNKRMRAYLDINCSYCHSHDGRAAFSRLYLDSFRPIDRHLGICRMPVTNGRYGSRRFDIEPGNAEASILHHRDIINGVMRMPPLARSLENREAAALMTDWINFALTDPSLDVRNTEDCSAGGPPIP